MRGRDREVEAAPVTVSDAEQLHRGYNDRAIRNRLAVPGSVKAAASVKRTDPTAVETLRAHPVREGLG